MTYYLMGAIYNPHRRVELLSEFPVLQFHRGHASMIQATRHLCNLLFA
jgi:hypothetical protein